jgi:hypothetical protein
MLQIADRRFQLLTPFSGLGVRLSPNSVEYKQQTWWLNTCWVPEDNDGAHPPWRGPEMWRLGMMHLGAQVSHWHELERFEMAEDDLGILAMSGSVQNIARYSGPENPALSFALDTFRFTGRTGYSLILEMAGEVLPQKEPGEEELCGDFSLRVEIPFHEAEVAVPLNATDALATATSIARREIGLSAHARHDVSLFDPTVPVWKPVENSHHTVLLETPWRE